MLENLMLTILIPYKVVANKEGRQDINKEKNKDNDPTPYLKEGDEKSNSNDSIDQCK